MISRSQFAVAFLNKIGITPNYDNVASIVAWASMENTQALNNPLATERVVNLGETDFNTSGVKNYPNFQIGLDALQQTITNGLYQNLLNELSNGNYNSITNAIDNSPWGTKGVNGVIVTYDFWNTNISSNDTVSVVVPPFEGEVPPVVKPVITYTIVSGDTLYGIAAKFNVNEANLFDVNQAELDGYARSRGYSSSNNGNLIFPSTKIIIP